MIRITSGTLCWMAALAVLALLGCRTADLISGTLARPTRAGAGNRAPTAAKMTPTPNAGFAFVPAGQASCKAGDNSASIVTGRITRNGAPVEGQRVQASAGRGGEPISEEPAVTDTDGTYQVTFVCDGKACSGSFWLWLVDEKLVQVSPFVEFLFDDNCRRGTANFRAP